MTAIRYAVSTTIPNYLLRDHLGDIYFDKLKRRMRDEMGARLVDVYEEAGKPITFMLEWLEYPPLDYFENHKLALVATVMPVEVMQVIVPNDMPWSYGIIGPEHLTGTHIPMEWQCGWCGQTNLISEHLECRKCGAPRKPLR